MGKISELSINAVTIEMRKLLYRITCVGQLVRGTGCVIIQDHRRRDRPCLSHVIHEERGKPTAPPFGQANRKEGCWGCGYGMPEKAKAGL